jgi:hypothetical protein
MILEARSEKKKWLVRFDTGLENWCPSVLFKLLSDPRYNRERSGARGTMISDINRIST